MRLQLCAVVAACLPGITAHADERLTPITAPELRSVLNELEGDVVLVNFWATWCTSCLKEIPALQELETELADRGLRLVAVALDEPESMDELVRPFMEKWFPELRSYMSMEPDMDDMVSVIDRGWNEVLPTSYVIGRDGNVIQRIQGSYTKAEFAAATKAPLDEAPPQD